MLAAVRKLRPLCERGVQMLWARTEAALSGFKDGTRAASVPVDFIRQVTTPERAWVCLAIVCLCAAAAWCLWLHRLK
jgi:hypothetical protein